MRARIRRTIKALDGFLIAFAIRKRPRVAQPQIAGGEDGGDLFDCALRRVLPVFHANLRSGRLKPEDRVWAAEGARRTWRRRCLGRLAWQPGVPPPTTTRSEEHSL